MGDVIRIGAAGEGTRRPSPDNAETKVAWHFLSACLADAVGFQQFGEMWRRRRGLFVDKRLKNLGECLQIRPEPVAKTRIAVPLHAEQVTVRTESVPCHAEYEAKRAERVAVQAERVTVHAELVAKHVEPEASHAEPVLKTHETVPLHSEIVTVPVVRTTHPYKEVTLRYCRTAARSQRPASASTFQMRYHEGLCQTTRRNNGAAGLRDPACSRY